METLENKRKRLIFRAGHRGTKEMDLILGNFAAEYVPDFNENELSEFDEILKENDPDLYNWLTGKEVLPANKLNPVFEKLIQFKLA